MTDETKQFKTKLYSLVDALQVICDDIDRFEGLVEDAKEKITLDQSRENFQELKDVLDAQCELLELLDGWQKFVAVSVEKIPHINQKLGYVWCNLTYVESFLECDKRKKEKLNVH